MDRGATELWRAKDVARLMGLSEAERRYYAKMLDALPIGLAVLSSARIIVSTNREFYDILKLSPAEFGSTTLDRAVLHMTGGKELIDLFERVLRRTPPSTTLPEDTVYLEFNDPKHKDQSRSYWASLTIQSDWGGGHDGEIVLALIDVAKVQPPSTRIP